MNRMIISHDWISKLFWNLPTNSLVLEWLQALQLSWILLCIHAMLWHHMFFYLAETFQPIGLKEIYIKVKHSVLLNSEMEHFNILTWRNNYREIKYSMTRMVQEQKKKKEREKNIQNLEMTFIMWRWKCGQRLAFEIVSSIGQVLTLLRILQSREKSPSNSWENYVRSKNISCPFWIWVLNLNIPFFTSWPFLSEIEITYSRFPVFKSTQFTDRSQNQSTNQSKSQWQRCIWQVLSIN